MADLARFGGQRSAVGGHWRLNPCQIAGVSVSEILDLRFTKDSANRKSLTVLFAL